MYYMFFIHSSTDGHVDCFPYLIIVNNVAFNMKGQTYFCYPGFVSYRYILQKWDWKSYMVVIFLIFWRNPVLFTKVTEPAHFPLVHKNFPFLYILADTVVFCLLKRCEIKSHFCLWFTFPWLVMLSSFRVPVVYFYIFFCENVYLIFCLLLIRLEGFWNWVVWIFNVFLYEAIIQYVVWFLLIFYFHCFCFLVSYAKNHCQTNVYFFIMILSIFTSFHVLWKWCKLCPISFFCMFLPHLPDIICWKGYPPHWGSYIDKYQLAIYGTAKKVDYMIVKGSEVGTVGRRMLANSCKLEDNSLRSRYSPTLL